MQNKMDRHYALGWCPFCGIGRAHSSAALPSKRSQKQQNTIVAHLRGALDSSGLKVDIKTPPSFSSMAYSLTPPTCPKKRPTPGIQEGKRIL